jgi:hypothetical protein
LDGNTTNISDAEDDFLLNQSTEMQKPILK